MKNLILPGLFQIRNLVLVFLILLLVCGCSRRYGCYYSTTHDVPQHNTCPVTLVMPVCTGS